MVRALDEAMSQLTRLAIQEKLMVITKRQFQHDIKTMFSLVDKLIAERRAHGHVGAEDLLARMLGSKDPDTGEALDDENIRYQIITFLIAGHETTSGLLSFALYFLLKHPQQLRKAYEEVDRVLADGAVPTYKQVLELKYIRMILSESLRLWPTAPAFSLYAKEDTLLAGKYPLKRGESVNVMIPKLHRDTAVWGDDADEFRPERFEDPAAIPHHAYKPFGNGQRACIGQQFALHEATLVLGMVLKYFDIIDHTNYRLKVKETLTLKPESFTMRVRPRHEVPLGFGGGGVGHAAAGAAVAAGAAALRGGTVAAGAAASGGAVERERAMRGGAVAGAVANGDAAVQERATADGSMGAIVGAGNVSLLVLYGSNLGTAEGIARELADTARLHGVRSEVAPLDDRIGRLPKEGAVFIVTASYNGKPPSNAKGFVQWLEGARAGELQGVRYAVFGCGDRNWASTYQDVPRFIDEQLAAKGATRLTARGEGDASGDPERQLEEWRGRLWADAMSAFGLKFDGNADKERGTLTVQFASGSAGSPLAESYEAVHAAVTANRELQSSGSGRSTRHIEVKLPQELSYQEGDHLGVLPSNRKQLVDRVLQRFGLNGSDYLILRASGSSANHLPLGRPVSLHDLLSLSVELQEAATRAQLRELASLTICPPHKREIEALLEEEMYKEQVLKKRLSMLDILERYEACEMPFARFLEMLPPLKARYYSISSSPLAQPGTASITVGVVQGPAWSGCGDYRGVASGYLADREAGENIMMFIRTPESGFQLPERTETPLIMVGPGTGVAPFRGFLQARRVMREQGRRLGEAHLFFGCRNDDDFIYREELEQFHAAGVVTLHTAFSRKEGIPKTYVQHLMRQQMPELIGLLEAGGKLYVCGDGAKMAPDVEATLLEGYRAVRGVSGEEARKWLGGLQAAGRYAKDVWAGG
jgi:cytochrome P450/NADPH-cytochrome P450 reductase